MYLKHLQIKGFKSFAEGASLHLEPGVTVVVGPNGSGKSNVVDAIGWVLGAQAPSAVRSQKMDDVIFAGSTKRPALGRAEVSLTIDNTSGMLPIDFTEVTISRTLFRSGDSEYAINGVPCRLLDISDLLSDSGVGRQQHVIISQGQIDAVLNARPEERRLIIEEAAGVLKFRRRKEKAERRLASTEANLTRIQDLLREVRRQLRPLERQASAAQRHGAVVAELNALKIHLAGRELARLRTTLADSHTTQADLRQTERRIRGTLSHLDAQVLATEAQLSAMGGPDSSDALLRYESLRERARGLTAVIAERRRGVSLEQSTSIDQTVVANLEAEVAQLRIDLAVVDGERAALSDDHESLASAVAELEGLRADFERQWAGGIDAASTEMAEVRSEIASMTTSIGRSEADLSRLRLRGEAAETRLRRLHAERGRLDQQIEDAVGVEPALAEAASAALKRAATAEEELARVSVEADAASQDRHRWSARAEALTMALDQARSAAGIAALEDLPGLVGTLLDVIEIEPGAESAVEAALAEALSAVVVDSPTAARAALDRLAELGEAGAVLALGNIAPTSLAAVPATQLVSNQAVRPLRDVVSSSAAGVDALLDQLLADTVWFDGVWQDALDVVAVRPSHIVVTTAGDRFSAAGWIIGRGSVGATGAALAEALDAAEAASQASQLADIAMVEAKTEVASSRELVTQTTRSLSEARSSCAAAQVAVERLGAELEDTQRDAAASAQHCADLETRLTDEVVALARLEERLPALLAAESDRTAREAELNAARLDLDAASAEVGTERSDVERRSAAIEERRRSVVDRIAGIEERLVHLEAERTTAAQRRTELVAIGDVLDRLTAFVAVRTNSIDEVLVDLRAQRQRHSERTRAVTTRLDELRRSRSDAERELEVVRERLQRTEIADAETNLRLEGATEALRRDFDCEPDVAIVALEPEVADGTTAVARARELDREVRLMGPINPLALEEFAALSERNELLESQLEDIRSARRELSKVIRAVDDEIVSVFAAAYSDVEANFVHLFSTLFPGGTGALRLTEAHDLLNCGIEIEAKPSGKNVKKLSLLSGGERSLTALAFLFAIFRSRPSPFYVMDEVEAALDDVNLHRFLGLVQEFRNDAQLIIVSHQKRTMEAADVLYGVTMEPGGSSKVISERVASVLD